MFFEPRRARGFEYLNGIGMPLLRKKSSPSVTKNFGKTKNLPK
jgi:hypothetical protein